MGPNLTPEEVRLLLLTIQAADHLAKCVQAHGNSDVTRQAGIEYMKLREQLGGEVGIK